MTASQGPSPNARNGAKARPMPALFASICAWVADPRGAAAHQHDRPIAGALQPAQQHDLHERADMQAVGGRVEADIAGDGAIARRQPGGIGDLVDEAAAVDGLQEIGGGAGHGVALGWRLEARRSTLAA